MSDYYLGQIMLTGFGFAQRGTAQCNGQIMPINQNTALFALLGTYYGGNGSSTFGLPDLQGRTPAGGGFGSANASSQAPGNQPYTLGQKAGSETVALVAANNPAHAHTMTAITAAGVNQYADGASAALAKPSAPTLLYGANNSLVTLDGSPSSSTGISSPHSNMQPFQVVNFNIVLQGIYPSRN